MLVALSACHSKKNISSSTTAHTNIIATSETRMSSALLDSAVHSLAIQLDSFSLTVEPIINPCPSCDTIRHEVMAYRYHLIANRATVKENGTAVSRSVGDTLQQDSIVIAHTHSSQRSERSDTTAVYRPPDLWLVIALLIILAVGFLVWKHCRK